jgi:hypothetical protein
MKMIFRHVRIAAFVALGILAGAVGAALGQAGWYQITSPAGTELVQVNVPASAYQNYVFLNQIRNTTGYQTVPTGGTVNSTPTNAVNNLIAIGAITTWNVTLPAGVSDGQLFAVVNSTAAAFTTNVTVTANAGQTLAVAYAAQTLAANGGGAEWQYSASNTTWYRVR